MSAGYCSAASMNAALRSDMAVPFGVDVVNGEGNSCGPDIGILELPTLRRPTLTPGVCDRVDVRLFAQRASDDRFPGSLIDHLGLGWIHFLFLFLSVGVWPPQVPAGSGHRSMWARHMLSSGHPPQLAAANACDSGSSAVHAAQFERVHGTGVPDCPRSAAAEYRLSSDRCCSGSRAAGLRLIVRLPSVARAAVGPRPACSWPRPA